eukprot:TRINITY_DN5603_c0_g1_i1.p1 TRINITY_DN5603_c0_g1~~TRINITY_DN5603_c0_g1_i1.p1  ORF type:complete len:380 (+),score=50.74 TRINITY_DN5603_c0_g1_i1:58-1197(+)
MMFLFLLPAVSFASRLTESPPLVSVPVVTNEDCSRCKSDRPEEYKKGGQFRRCTTGYKASDTAWCSENLCMSFVGTDDPNAAECKRTFSPAEFFAHDMGEEGFENVLNILKKKGLKVPEKPIMLNSQKGSELLMEAATAKMHWPYLMLPFQTQPWWSYCGLTSLVIALNYLQVPPPYFMGTFRWWSEVKVLDLYPIMKRHIDVWPSGTTINELSCIARDLGLSADLKHAAHRGAEQDFKDALRAVTNETSFKKAILLVNFHRNGVGQSGIGHWSPVAAYAQNSDMVLVMDVSRYKFPPWWVRVKDLVRAMNTHDDESAVSRGWMLLKRDGHQPPAKLHKCAAFHDFYADHGEDPWDPSDEGLSEDAVRDVMVNDREMWH